MSKSRRNRRRGNQLIRIRVTVLGKSRLKVTNPSSFIKFLGRKRFVSVDCTLVIFRVPSNEFNLLLLCFAERVGNRADE